MGEHILRVLIAENNAIVEEGLRKAKSVTLGFPQNNLILSYSKAGELDTKGCLRLCLYEKKC